MPVCRKRRDTDFACVLLAGWQPAAWRDKRHKCRRDLNVVLAFVNDMIHDPEVARKIAEFKRKLEQVSAAAGPSVSGKGPALVAVSKTHPAAAIQAAYDGGQRLFGENRVQELVDKQAALPPDIAWHLIGHLQRNKVKYVAPFVSMIHATDSERLLAEVHRQAEKIGRQIPVLLQVHIADESNKFGWEPDALLPWLQTGAWKAFSAAPIHGLMGMATFTEDRSQVRREFQGLRKLFDACREQVFADGPLDADGLPLFRELSMGMSGDWDLAVEEGASLIRVGSALFGAR